MKTYSVKFDEKVTVWLRQQCIVDAESEEEALEKAKQQLENEGPNHFEYLPDTEEPLTEEENGNQPVKETLIEVIAVIEPKPETKVLTKEEMLNEGQRQAVEKAMKILTARTNKDLFQDMFLLSGKGGTGKTFTTEVIVDNIKEHDDYATICHVAPTWNAVNEVVKASSVDDYPVITLASFLGTNLSEPDANGVQTFILHSEKKIEQLLDSDYPLPAVYTADYIILDEASMIGGDGNPPKLRYDGTMVASDAWQALLKRLEHRKKLNMGRPLKILLVGDYAQIPPIGTTKDHDATIIETMLQSDDTHHVLTQNMRTGHDDLNQLHDLYRVNIDVARDGVKKGIPSNTSIQRNPNPIQNRVNTPNIQYLNKAQDVVEKYTEIYKQNPEDITNVVFVNYNRYTHQRTQNIINRIRQRLFGEDARNNINPGELMILEGRLITELLHDGRFTEFTFQNETRFYIEKVVRNVSKTIRKEVRVGSRICNHEVTFQGDNLTMITNYGKKQIKFTEFVPYPGQLERYFGKYNADIKGFMVGNIKIPYGVYLKFKDELPVLNYGYVVNSHKVQGSSYNYTLVDESNILASPTTNKEANNLIYTAISRPKKGLIVYNENNPVQEPVLT